MDKLLFKRIVVGILTVLAVVYVAYLLISANFDMYSTEDAVETTISDKIYSNAFIIRDESIIENNTSGVLSYTRDNGEAVAVDSVVAKIYQNESDALAQTTADALEENKNALEELQKNNTGTMGIDAINNDIQNNLLSYLSNINDGNIANAFSYSSDLLSAINQRQLYTGKLTNFNSEIANLNSEITNLRQNSGESIGEIKTTKSGYFSENCDGYENVIKFSDIDKMELNDLNNIKQSNVSSNAAGKIVSNKDWYVACQVSSDEAKQLSLWSDDVTLLFSDATKESITASIYRIAQETNDSDALLILKCNDMSSELIEARKEPIEIGLGTYTGLRVSKRAIHDDYVTKTVTDENNNTHETKEKVQGVYVLYGSEVQFKQISILYADDDYVICDPAPDSDELFNGETISLYDQIIIKGDDLYDGKVIK